jgi:hypothetical protein
MLSSVDAIMVPTAGTTTVRRRHRGPRPWNPVVTAPLTATSLEEPATSSVIGPRDSPAAVPCRIQGDTLARSGHRQVPRRPTRAVVPAICRPRRRGGLSLGVPSFTACPRASVPPFTIEHLMRKLLNRVRSVRDFVHGAHRYHLGPAIRSRKIFVLGTGRSGTHWLGYIIGAHRDVIATVEKRPIFPWVVQLALYPDRFGELYPKLVQRYRYEHALVAPRHYLDKSHPNIWLADSLVATFPDTLFIGIRRDVFGTVNSMLQHPDVMRWIHRWQNYPVPNRFLGIDPRYTDEYHQLPIESKCAVRWKAHVMQLEHIKEKLGDCVLIVDYDDLHKKNSEKLDEISLFLQLDSAIPKPPIKESSLERWQNELSQEQCQNIERALRSFPVFHSTVDWSTHWTARRPQR